jgi:hypothetical protein
MTAFPSDGPGRTPAPVTDPEIASKICLVVTGLVLDRANLASRTLSNQHGRIVARTPVRPTLAKHSIAGDDIQDAGDRSDLMALLLRSRRRRWAHPQNLGQMREMRWKRFVERVEALVHAAFAKTPKRYRACRVAPGKFVRQFEVFAGTGE